MDTKEKLVIIINFLDPFFKIILCLKTNQPISTDIISKFGKKSFQNEFLGENGFIKPHIYQYRDFGLYFRKYRDKTKYLPFSLSEEGSLYQLENNKVFELNSQLEKDFASRYQLVAIDPEIASTLRAYGFVKELDLGSIFFYVKQECESSIKLEKEFLLLLYRLMVDKENQLIGNSELKLLIENLPIFIDNKGNSCSLKNEQKEVFLQGSFDDYTGIARILDDEMIDSVDEFKKSILIDYFKIKTLDFRLFVETYFEEIFNESDADTDKKLKYKKLKLIKDLSRSNLESKEVGKILENTKFIYCNDHEFHYPSEIGIFYLASKEKKSFALKNGLPIMYPNVKAIVSRYNLTKSLELDNILSYAEANFNKGESLKDSDAVLLYKLIYDDRKSLSDKELKSRIRRLSIFKNTKGNLCTLENNGKEMVLLGDYRDPIGIDEILSNDLIDKVNNFKEKVIKEYLEVKTLDFKLFVERYLPEIFNDESIEKSKKLELRKELNEKFLVLKENLNFINILKRIKIVYCQDGNFYFPSHENLYIKNELIDEIFEDDYLFPCLEDFEDYRRMYEILEIKSQLSPREIIDYVKKKISLEEVNVNLINKMRNIFVYINDHWKSFEGFSELAEIKWLPATDDSKTLYNPPSLFTQSKGQNTRPYLIYLDNIKYLDVKDKHLTTDNNNVRSIKSKLIDVIGLNNVSKIPTPMIIENLRLASESAINIQNPLQIYLELNNRSNETEINKLNDFSSIYVKYENDKKSFYFKPKDVFIDNEQKLFGNEYIGFLSSDFFVKCNKLVDRLGILNKPDIYSVKRILGKINEKYENNSFIISSDVDKDDRTIVISCLERLSENVNKIDSNFISELHNLHIFFNDNDQLLTPLEAILEDNPNIANQFPKEFRNYLVKYDLKYLALEEKLDLKRLSKLINKRLETEPILDSSKINSELTTKMRSIAKLMNRIKNENKGLDKDGEDNWIIINQDIKVYTFENLNVTKYVNWLDQKYHSSNKSIDCYFVKNGSELDVTYTKNSKTQVLNSVAQELFEEIHPHMNKNFIAVLHALLRFDSYGDMSNYLTELGYAKIEEDQNTLLNEKIIESENAEEFDENEDIEDDTILDKDSVHIKSSSFSLSPSITSINPSFSEETTSNFSNEAEALITNNLRFIDGLNKENKVYSNNNFYKLENDYNGKENECLESKDELGQVHRKGKNSICSDNFSKEDYFVTSKDDLDNFKLTKQKKTVNETVTHENNGLPQLDTNAENIKKFRTLSPSKDTNYSEKTNELYSGIFSTTKHKNNSSGIEEIEIPLSREEAQTIKKNTNERIKQRIIEARYHNKSRGKSERPDPNIKDETAINEVKEWYKCRCQICGRTFRKKSGSGNYCEVAHLIEIKNQGISDISNMVCLCSYHAAVLKKGFFEIVPESIKKNKVTIRVYDEYDAIENKYKTNEYVIKYRQNHFLDFQALLELNNE